MDCGFVYFKFDNTGKYIMASKELCARHVFHAETSGTDRIDAWREATGEPVFVWGSHSNQADGVFFGSVKSAFRSWLQETNNADLTIYHDGAGVDALGPLDPTPDKVLFLHQLFPRWERHFEWMIRCTGRILLGNPEMVEVLRDRFAWIPSKYVNWIGSPGLTDGLLTQGEGTGAKRRTGIWLHGKPWKRFGNRLRSVIDRWSPESGQLEIIASGKRVPRWANREWIRWSANLPLEFALLRLHTWDSTLLLNDYNLDAPWLMKALGLGCFPIIPDGGSLTRRGPWMQAFAPRGYEWGDTHSAMELLTQWRSNRDSLSGDFTAWTKQLLAERDEGFSTRWAHVKAELLAHRAPAIRPRKAVRPWFPVGLYERVQRMRSGL
jgi:hypothetical protein